MTREDYTNVVQFWDNDRITEFYPDWYENDSLLDTFADSNMSCIVIEGKTLPIAFDREKSLLILFNVADVSQELANKAEQVLQDCEWEPDPKADPDNRIEIINGLYNIVEIYNF